MEAASCARHFPGGREKACGVKVVQRKTVCVSGEEKDYVCKKSPERKLHCLLRMQKLSEVIACVTALFEEVKCRFQGRFMSEAALKWKSTHREVKVHPFTCDNPEA
jgi:hypothetical protein